ncbi:MAG TPA: hypothetical protein VEX86_23985 [Longimicrobium sp.]|nr:hypothetical protein [Longimicrobium sp.]
MKSTAAHPAVQRTATHRSTALLALLFFLFTWTGEALGVHGCPHHDAVPAAAAAQAEHGHHGMQAGEHDAPAPEHGDSHACTCQGTCPSVIGGALPPVGDSWRRVAPAAVSQAAAPRAASIVPRLVPFFLPYGQAPPPLG